VIHGYFAKLSEVLQSESRNRVSQNSLSNTSNEFENRKSSI
jgi:hypothetical protein